MGTLRCDGCGEEFFIVHHLAFAVSGSLTNKHTGSKRFLLKSTSATRSTPTELNCRSDPQIMDRKSIERFPLRVPKPTALAAQQAGT